MKKKLYSFICLALLVLVVVGIFYTVYRDSHGYLGVPNMAKWSVDENGRLTVSGSGIIGHDIDYHFTNDIDSVLYYKNDIEDEYEKGTGLFPYAVLKTELKAMDIESSKTDTIKSVVIEDGITEIGVQVFCYLTDMNTVKFPDTLKVIHDSAFEGCGLESVEIPESVSIVRDYAFSSCNDLSEIKLHNGLVKIGKGVFEGCIVSELCIPKTVSEIGGYDFLYLENLTDLYIYPTTVPKITDDNYVNKINENLTVHVPENSKGYDEYPWTNYNVVYDL